MVTKNLRRARSRTTTARRRAQKTTSSVGFLLCAALTLFCPGRSVGAPTTPHGSPGTLYGQVIDTDSGRPIPDALIAVRNDHGQVVAWTRSDASGNYALSAPVLDVLRLRPSHRKSMAAKVFGVGATIVGAPVKFVGGAFRGGPMDFVHAVISGVIGGPAAVVGLAIGRLEGAAMGRVSDAVNSSIAENAVLNSVGAELAGGVKGDAPGVASLTISAPRFKDLSVRCASYWLDGPHGASGASAWLEPVGLAPVGSTRAGGVHLTAIQLSDLHVTNSLVPSGQNAHVSVKLNTPDGRILPIRIFARESLSGHVVELTRSDGDWIYAGDIPVATASHSGPSLISVIALRTETVALELPPAVGADGVLLSAAKRLPALRPDQPFTYDPRLFAAENRLTTAITILGAKDETAALPSSLPGIASAAQTSGR
jgi:hypothetical protein